MARELKYTISGDPRDFNRALSSVDRRLDTSDKNARRFGSSLASTFRGVGHAAGYLGVAIGAGVVVEAKRAVTAFQESNKVARQTQAVLKSTGGQANVTAEAVAHLATAISRKTGIDDEQIQSAENLLLTFTNVRNEAGKGNKVFDQTVRLGTDMAVALGTDAKSAAMQLGKALNDPEKGVTKLMRSGVSFTEQQKEQIATLQASGDMLGAQKIILGEVSKEFEGSAQAQATSTGKLKVAFGNLEEDLGSGLAPAVDAVANKLTHFAHDVEPQVIKAADRIAKTFGRKDLSLDQKFRLSAQQAREVFRPLIDEAGKSIRGAHFDDKLEHAFEEGAPKIVSAVAAAAPRAAGMFIRTFKDASPWGKALTVAFLIGKFGAFRGAGTWAAKALIGRMVAVFAADKALETAAGAAGTRSGTRFGTRFRTRARTSVASFFAGGGLAAAASGFGLVLAAAAATAFMIKFSAEMNKKLRDLFGTDAGNLLTLLTSPTGAAGVVLGNQSTAGEVAAQHANESTGSRPNPLNTGSLPGGLPRKPRMAMTSGLTSGFVRSSQMSNSRATRRAAAHASAIQSVPGFPGEEADSSVIGVIQYVASHFGLTLTDAFDRDHSAGHKSPGHNVTGTAGDFAGSDANMDKAVKWLVKQGYTVGYDGRFGSQKWAGHGPSYVAGGNAHLHAELGSGGTGTPAASKKKRKGSRSRASWARTVLTRLGIKPNDDNMQAMLGWMAAEGGHWNNDADYNPLNTTQSMPGARNINSVGVKAYVSWEQGFDATIKTLRYPAYRGILVALRGHSAAAVAGAIGSSPWGTMGGLVASAIAGAPTDKGHGPLFGDADQIAGTRDANREAFRQRREARRQRRKDRREIKRQHARDVNKSIREHTPTSRDRYEQELANLDVAAAEAETTPGREDDTAVLAGRAITLQKRLDRINKLLKRKGLTVAQRKNLTREKADILAELAGLGQTYAGYQEEYAAAAAEGEQSQADLLAAHTEALKELTAAQLADTDLRSRIFNSDHGQIMAGIADMVSGQLGGRIGLGIQTPGFAAGRVRY